MLSGIYWTFPPIFADAESVVSRAVEARRPVQTASLDGATQAEALSFDTLPDIQLTPSIRAHRKTIEMLEAGVARLNAVSGYTAEFAKTEVVSGSLTDPQTMRLKLRHEPFSVYMKWTEGSPGQELLYVEGQQDGEMIVRPGGLRGRFLGAIKLDPTGTLALSESRHPVTQIGLLHLSKKILDYRYDEAGWTSGYTCTEDSATVGDRPCRRFTIVYDSPTVRADYRKSVIWIDEELQLATKIENYGWPAEDYASDRVDSETLLESYRYTNINLDSHLAAVDFTAANEDYGLRRR